MPFDGIVTKCISKELSDTLVGSRIEKIFQPEKDEILMNIRAQGQNLKLLLSANANYPRVHITWVSKENPANPPVFCMLLRKHLSGGRIVGIDFHDFERIITINIEAMNELGDLSVKKLIIEIMGRHSNIILTTSEDRIIDSIKHVDNEVSSVREVMPARTYVLPPSQNKTNPLELDTDKFFRISAETPLVSIEKYLLNNLKGFSPLLCSEVCYRSCVDGKNSINRLLAEEVSRLESVLSDIIDEIKQDNFSPCIIMDGAAAPGKPIDFHCLPIKQHPNIKYIDSISKTLDIFYSTRDNIERQKHKKADLYKVLNNNMDRCNKKLALQQEKLREVSDRENLKLYGELITANIYCIPANTDKVSLLNYYSQDSEYLEIKLDENLSAQQNAQRYYRQYTKAKSAYSYTSKLMEDTRGELDYLESVLLLLDNCNSLQEIEEIREELIEQGYYSLKRKQNSKKRQSGSEPLHFKSSDGFDIFVGKNNKQNDQLTLKLSSSNDIWLHTKNIPGSHVIIKKLQHEIPGRTLEEAGMLAAYHSKAKMSSGVPVDYTAVKNVKKPSGAKPGMVIYDNFKTMIVTPDEETVNKLRT
ncbi:MAG: NFACT family protein [Clostridia bacterium]|nr:NFACT family protein [Clostridia bacterium]